MPEPYCLAMVLCDAVHTDPATGKKTILGTFSCVNALEFPTKLRLCVYYAITDAEGEQTLTLRIVDSKHLFQDEVEPLFSFEARPDSTSPLAVLEAVTLINGLEIPSPGVYHCELLCGEDVLMARRLLAMQVEKPPNEH